MTEHRRWRREAAAVPENGENEGSGNLDEEPEGGLFTRFLRALEPGREPAEELVTAIWRELGQLLRRELRRRRLIHGSPVWLGIYGHRGWWDDTGASGPFEELRAAAYEHVFIDRLGFLKEQVDAGREVEALVTSCVQQFLHKQQTRHDRLGSRLFEVLRAAARKAVAAGNLVLVSGSEKITASTVLVLENLDRPAPLAAPEKLKEVARSLNDAFLPDLVTALRADRRRLVDELARRLGELDLADVEAFRFGALLAPLQADVRARWSALATPGEPGEPDDTIGGLEALERRFDSFEDRLVALDWVEKMIDCADRLLESSGESERSRRYLRRLLAFLRVFLGRESAPGEDGGIDFGDELPSGRSLGGHLKIQRERLGGLFGKVKEFFEQCREELGARAAIRREVPR